VQQITTSGFAFASLVISGKLTAGWNSFPAARWTDISTARAAYEATTWDGAPRELAVGRLLRVFILCRAQTVNKSLYSSLA